MQATFREKIYFRSKSAPCFSTRFVKAYVQFDKKTGVAPWNKANWKQDKD